jgi:REP element-mobilizing transposase RayT
MARPLRLELHGGLYHVTSRGNGRADIYRSDGDRHRFLHTLGSTQSRYNWVVHAYCLMSNHYHLLVETPDANLARGMQVLNSVYSQGFNRRYGHVGHLFQGRYKAILVEKDSHLLELARYIVLNPVRAGLAAAPLDWPWSSHRAVIGATLPPEWLETRWILAPFGDTRQGAVERYTRFVADGLRQPSPWTRVKRQIFLGSDDFVASMERLIPSDCDLLEVPQAKARPVAQPLAYYATAHRERDRAIAAAYASGAYSMRQIGDYFGMHPSRVSRIIKAVAYSIADTPEHALGVRS